MSKKKNTPEKAVPAVEFKGLVTRTTGTFCSVKDAEGKITECTFKGKLRIDKDLRSTNPVAVGDEVKFVMNEKEDTGVVVSVLPRKNYILRKAIAHARKVHILCANVDQVVLIYTLKSPRTSAGFANRFLMIAEAYSIPAVIIINKIDLLTTEEELEYLQEVKSEYESIAYPVYCVSALDSGYKETLMKVFEGKISFLGGHSGSGKSSILNLLRPDLNIRTQVISNYNDKGMHTTTFTEMHPLLDDAYVIDAPGIKEMGLVDFDKNEIAHYFPEMRNRMHLCKFNNCTHIHEPHCAIIDAVKNGEIPFSRYDSYVKIFLNQESEQEE